MNPGDQDFIKLAKEYAPGIKRKDYPGDINKLKPGQLLDYVIQKHEALRAGTHKDFRIGNKQLGMYSWAMRSGLPSDPADKRLAARTNLHTREYADWEGVIPKGTYGAGKVTKEDEGKVLITNTTPTTVSFSVAHKKHPQRFTLVKPPGFAPKDWLLIKKHTPAVSGAEKVSYKSISKEELDKALENLKPGAEVQAKVDGALNFLNLTNGKAEMLSHRTSATTGRPVVQTERFFGHVPHLELPNELKNAVLLAEVYGEKDGKPIELQALGGILNSSLANALKTQDEKGIKMRALLFDVAKLKGKDIRSTLPYSERKEILKKFIEYLPKGKFHLPESVNTSEEAKKLIETIRSGKHPMTTEGIVIHNQDGHPLKHKITSESDVYVRELFPAEEGSKYDKNSVGGFKYSVTPDGPILGRVGGGLSDAMRKLMHDDPERFKGRIARIHSQSQYPSGAHRNPNFIALHEDYPHKEKQSEFKPDFTPKELKELGVFDEVYGGGKQLASMDKWPEHWLHPQDPKGWLQWYERYNEGRRTDDDARQIKRWKSFKARHGAQFTKNPTPRRAFALQHWAIDPTKLTDDAAKVLKTMDEYKQKVQSK